MGVEMRQEPPHPHGLAVAWLAVLWLAILVRLWA